MVYKRVRGRTTGRSLPVLNFVKYSPPPGGRIVGYWVEYLTKKIIISLVHKNTPTHGCRRHPFSRFPDKINYPWPEKCKIPGLIVAAASACSFKFIEITLNPKVSSSLQWFINSAVLNYLIFTHFYSKCQFFQTLNNRNKLPWPLHDLEEYFPEPFPDLWQPWYL